MSDVTSEQCIERFVTYKTVEKGLSPLTISAYRTDLAQLSEFLGSRPLVDAQRRDIGEFIEKLLSAYMKDSSVRRKIATFRSFFLFLLLDGVTHDNPVAHIGSIKVGRVLHKALTISEMNALLEVDPPRETRHAEFRRLRDHAILELMYSSGLRVSEITDALLERLKLIERHIVIQGKGNKERIVPIGHIAADALKQYVASRHDSSVWLFIGRPGGKLTRQLVWQVVKKAAQKIGRHVHPHMLRHSCATHLMDNGANLRVVQEILGHVDISTTELYTHCSVESVRKIYLRCHPRAHANRQLKLQLDLMPVEILAVGPVVCSQCLRVAQQGKAKCELHMRKGCEAVRRSRERAKLRA